MSDIVDRLKDGADRFLKWAYKNPYDGPPVISIPRHDGNIDALLIEAADKILALYDEVRMLHGEVDRFEDENTSLRAQLARVRNETTDADKYNSALLDAQVAIRKLKDAGK